MESAAVFMDQMEGRALPVQSQVVTGRAKKISENRRKISSIAVWVYSVNPPIYGPIYAPGARPPRVGRGTFALCILQARHLMHCNHYACMLHPRIAISMPVKPVPNAILTVTCSLGVALFAP